MSIGAHAHEPQLMHYLSLQSTSKSRHLTQDTRSCEPGQPQDTNQAPSSKSSVVKLASHSAPQVDAERALVFHNSSQPASAPISRTNSETSLYMPMRRRSIVQRPGVATRLHHSNPPMPSKSSFRKSLPASPSQTRSNLTESDEVRRISMPPIQLASQSSDRVITPCDLDYKQLGVMKFGSLRITNGAPRQTPTPGFADEFNIDPVDPGEDYFDLKTNPLASISPGLQDAGSTQSRLTNEQSQIGIPCTIPEVPGGTVKSRTGKDEMSDVGNVGPFRPSTNIHTKGDSNANASPENSCMDVSNKTMNSLDRSDSGLISSLSSESSQKAPSKVDSGYSSNVSLRSFPSLRSATTDRSASSSHKMDSASHDANSTSDSSSRCTSSPPSQTRRLPSHLKVPLPATPETSPKSWSFSSFAHGSRIQFPSLRSARSQEFRDARMGGKPTPVPIIITHDAPDSLLPHSLPDGSRNSGRLQKFLGGSRKRGPPKVRDLHTHEREVAAFSEREDRLSDANGRLRPESRRLSQPSKETLRTILSVGSADCPQVEREQSSKDNQTSPKGETKQFPRRKSWRMATQSIAKSLFGSRTATSGGTKIVEIKQDNPRPSNALKFGSKAVENNSSHRAVSSHQPSARRASSFMASSNNTTPTPSDKRLSRDKPELNHLRTNVSTPKLSEMRRSSLNPSPSQTFNSYKTRASPPVSMQTRIPKPTRGHSSSRSRSMTASQATVVSKPVANRRMSLPQDLNQHGMQDSTSQIVHEYHQRQSPSWNGSPMVSRHNPTLSYSSTGQQVAASSPSSYRNRRASVSLQTMQTPTSNQQHKPTLLQQQHRSQAWPVVDMNSLNNLNNINMINNMHMNAMNAVDNRNVMSNMNATNQQWQHTYALQPQAIPYGMSQMVQQYPELYVTSPVPSIQAHGRAVSQGSFHGHNPPFKVLRSYGSPAYRGTPVWG